MTPQQRLDEAETWVFEKLTVICCDKDATARERNQAFKRLMAMYGMAESLDILHQFIINGYHQ